MPQHVSVTIYWERGLKCVCSDCHVVIDQKHQNTALLIFAPTVHTPPVYIAAWHFILWQLSVKGQTGNVGQRGHNTTEVHIQTCTGSIAAMWQLVISRLWAPFKLMQRQTCITNISISTTDWLFQTDVLWWMKSNSVVTVSLTTIFLLCTVFISFTLRVPLCQLQIIKSTVYCTRVPLSTDLLNFQLDTCH